MDATCIETAGRQTMRRKRARIGMGGLFPSARKANLEGSCHTASGQQRERITRGRREAGSGICRSETRNSACVKQIVKAETNL